MDIYKINDIAELIEGNSYVGRGIVIGKSADGKNAVSAYFIMGRSANSRNRVFTERDGAVFTEPFDASKVEDPSLIIYAAIREYENNLIVRADKPYKLENGEETATGLETNYITNEDPGFVCEACKNYALKPDSIVFEKIPGFVAPPFEKMGPIDDYAE